MQEKKSGIKGTSDHTLKLIESPKWAATMEDGGGKKIVGIVRLAPRSVYD